MNILILGLDKGGRMLKSILISYCVIKNVYLLIMCISDNAFNSSQKTGKY